MSQISGIFESEWIQLVEELFGNPLTVISYNMFNADSPIFVKDVLVNVVCICTCFPSEQDLKTQLCCDHTMNQHIWSFESDEIILASIIIYACCVNGYGKFN